MMSVDHETFTQVDSAPESKQETKEDKPKPKESKLKTELRQYQSKTLEAFGKEGQADKIPSDIHSKLYNKGQLTDFLRKVKEATNSKDSSYDEKNT